MTYPKQSADGSARADRLSYRWHIRRSPFTCRWPTNICIKPFIVGTRATTRALSDYVAAEIAVVHLCNFYRLKSTSCLVISVSLFIQRKMLFLDTLERLQKELPLEPLRNRLNTSRRYHSPGNYIFLNSIYSLLGMPFTLFLYARALRCSN